MGIDATQNCHSDTAASIPVVLHQARECNLEQPHNTLSKPKSAGIHAGINLHELPPPFKYNNLAKLLKTKMTNASS